MAYELSLIDNWVKVIYIDSGDLNKGIFKGEQSPLYRDIPAGFPKYSDGGKDYTVPVRGGTKQTTGRSSKSVYDRNVSGSTGKRLIMKYNMVEDFDEIHINRLTKLQSSGNEGVFLDVFNDDIMQSVAAMQLNLIRGQWGGDGMGTIGRVSSVSGKVVTLLDATSIQVFQPGMKLEFAAAMYNGSTDSRRAVASGQKLAEIEKIDERTFKITLDEAANIAANDYIWRENDYLKSNDSAQKVGFSDASPATPGTFAGLDQSISTARLLGYHVKPPTNFMGGRTKGEALYNALCVASVRVGQAYPMISINKITCNPEVSILFNTDAFFKDKIRWLQESEKEKYGVIGFPSFVLQTGTGKGGIPIVVDPTCSREKVYGYNNKCWTLRYLSEKKGSVINFKEQSGSRVIVDPHGTNVDMVKLESYTHNECSLPGANFCIDIKNLI